MKSVNETVKKTYGNYPEKILQFGEGNFLRAFADWMVDKANRDGLFAGSIVICQPISSGMADVINAQEGIYTLAMRGMENGTPVEKIEQITSVSRCINPYKNYKDLMDLARSEDLQIVISNTTEAGIAYNPDDKITDTPPSSFPAKVTALLYERFQAFHGAQDKGLLFLPVELIDHNGSELKRIVLTYAADWELGKPFADWIETANKFTNTLVDRIVTGYPKNQLDYFEEKLGYKDDAIVTSEIFNLWVIEGKMEWADILPIHKTDAHVLWTENVAPYKKRKVRILNGAHTSTVLAAYLAGHNIVRELMNDPVFRGFLDHLIHEEVIPTLDLPKEELESFAASVDDRFANPYIDHRLLDISLNSCSKFTTRCLPSILAYYEARAGLPKRLCFSLAAFIKFYQCKHEDGRYMGIRNDGTAYQIKDDSQVLDFFETVWSNPNPDFVARAVLSNKTFWNNVDLTEIPGLTELIASYLSEMETKIIREIAAKLA